MSAYFFLSFRPCYCVILYPRLICKAYCGVGELKASHDEADWLKYLISESIDQFNEEKRKYSTTFVDISLRLQ
jgi:hypothetical protein